MLNIRLFNNDFFCFETQLPNLCFGQGFTFSQLRDLPTQAEFSIYSKWDVYVGTYSSKSLIEAIVRVDGDVFSC